MAIVDDKPLSLEANSWQTSDIYQNYLKSLGQTEWSSALKQVNIKPIALKSMPNLGLDPITNSVTETKQDIEKTNDFFNNYNKNNILEEKIKNNGNTAGNFLKEFFQNNKKQKPEITNNSTQKVNTNTANTEKIKGEKWA